MSSSEPELLRVLFLGPLRDLVGCAFTQIECPTDGAQSSFWKNLTELFPVLRAQQGALRLARGNEFLEPTARLSPGDEIALIPPVSGG